MGRHSSSNQTPFVRSFVAWISLWVAIAVITGVAVWVVVKAIGGPQPIAGAETGDRTTASPTPSEDAGEDEIVVATPSPSRPPAPTPTPDETRGDAKLVTEGITIQVLNGTAQPAAAQDMADRLGGLGFNVVAVEESSRIYPTTTVFWSTPEARRAAQRLASRFGWAVEEKPANLSAEVSMHVVVGSDEA